MIPVSRVFDFPVNSCRKSWYSLVSEICSLWDEYMFMVAKNDMSSSKRPTVLPPLSASNSPNLSHVQWGNTMGLGLTLRKDTRSATRSRMSDRNS